MADPDVGVPDASGLRALSHPLRLRMLGLLRTHGPATATALARRLGLNSGATSYHLRQLAQHGFITEDPGRGNARDRWWRAAHRTTHTTADDLTSPEDFETYAGYLQAVGVVYAQTLQRAIEQHPQLPEPWRRAEVFSDWVVRVTPDRARALRVELAEVVERYLRNQDDHPDAAPFRVNVNAFLAPGAAPEVEES